MKRQAKTLIVDDSKAVLSMMEGMLKYYGIDGIDKAANGQVAVDQFQQALSAGTPYSLVFLDIVMPVMDGQTALRQMRAIEAAAGVTGEQRATIIMATSLSSTTDMVDALIEGDCTDYLIKPFEVDDVLGMLTKHGYVDTTCRQQ